jgi:hypothetical protein
VVGRPHAGVRRDRAADLGLPGAAARQLVAAQIRRRATRFPIRNVDKLYQGRVRGLDDFSPEVEPGVLGYLPQDFGVYPHLNAVESLSYLVAVKRVPRARARERIPELLALACGAWSNTNKLFEARSVVLWSMGPLKGVPGLDSMGVTLGAPIAPASVGAAPPPPGVAHPGLALAAGCLGAALLARARRLNA